VTGEADLPLGEHIEGMLNARLALELDIAGNLVPLLLQEVLEPGLQLGIYCRLLRHITHL